MKYKPTPFNVAFLATVGVAIWYFINARNNNNFDRHGWLGLMAVLPALGFGLALFFVDLGIQRSKKPRTYGRIAIVEGFILAAVLMLLFGFGFIHLS